MRWPWEEVEEVVPNDVVEDAGVARALLEEFGDAVEGVVNGEDEFDRGDVACRRDMLGSCGCNQVVALISSLWTPMSFAA